MIKLPIKTKRINCNMNNSNLCLNNCGFFGNSSFHGYCSKCWKERCSDDKRNVVEVVDSKAQQQQSKVKPVDERMLDRKINDDVHPVINVPVLPIVAEKKTETEKPVFKSQPGNRCIECRKKIGIYGFTCKCDGYFCTVHRYPESHSCTFNYKKEGEMKITKENPVIKASKVIKI